MILAVMMVVACIRFLQPSLLTTREWRLRAGFGRQGRLGKRRAKLLGNSKVQRKFKRTPDKIRYPPPELGGSSRLGECIMSSEGNNVSVNLMVPRNKHRGSQRGLHELPCEFWRGLLLDFK